ncbi:hypothetical protein TNCV_4537321 [Trichonephila clavipes]|nr:hypothetical protein TNCV_4537321 [Trichonephila clavipes]
MMRKGTFGKFFRTRCDLRSRGKGRGKCNMLFGEQRFNYEPFSLVLLNSNAIQGNNIHSSVTSEVKDWSNPFQLIKLHLAPNAPPEFFLMSNHLRSKKRKRGFTTENVSRNVTPATHQDKENNRLDFLRKTQPLARKFYYESQSEIKISTDVSQKKNYRCCDEQHLPEEDPRNSSRLRARMFTPVVSLSFEQDSGDSTIWLGYTPI